MRSHGLLLASFLLLFGAASADYNPVGCGSRTVHSQADVDAAVGDRGCQNIDEDVVLASDATGDISLDGITTIGGSLRSENGSQVTALRNKQIWEISGDLLLWDMSKLQTLDFKNLLSVGRFKEVGNVVLENLPVVAKIDLYELYGFYEFHAVQLPALQEFWQMQTPSHDSRVIEIRGVPLLVIDEALVLLHTEYSDSHNIDHFQISASNTNDPAYVPSPSSEKDEWSGRHYDIIKLHGADGAGPQRPSRRLNPHQSRWPRPDLRRSIPRPQRLQPWVRRAGRPEQP